MLYALVLAILIADALTSAGVVVGFLLAVPILLSSTGDDRRQVILLSATCVVGFLVAAVFGRGPISPEAVWLPNRLLALVAIAASGVLSLVLQRRRLDAEAARADAEIARADAESARDLTRLLRSLMAHDLRSPLALARQMLEGVERSIRAGDPVDVALLGDVDARLRRSLRAIQLVLDSARADLAPLAAASPVDIAGEIREELASFEEEARNRGKEIRLDVAGGELVARLDPSVLRQALAILVDNAIRYADPGEILVSAHVRGGELAVIVRDGGPGLGRRRSGPAGGGAGLGLKLSLPIST